MPRDDCCDQEGDEAGVTEPQLGCKRDENTRSDQVDDNLANALLVAAGHPSPTIPGSHIVEPKDVFAKEGKQCHLHDNSVVIQMKSFVVHSLLKVVLRLFSNTLPGFCWRKTMSVTLAFALSRVTLNITSLVTRKNRVRTFSSRSDANDVDVV